MIHSKIQKRKGEKMRLPFFKKKPEYVPFKFPPRERRVLITDAENLATALNRAYKVLPFEASLPEVYLHPISEKYTIIYIAEVKNKETMLTPSLPS